MSSMGDVFHAFPALSDALQNIADLKVDWVVESTFAEIPTWHPAVNQVFPIDLRAWRKSPFKSRQKIKDFFKQVNAQSYDLVIDAQGLLKSAWVMGKINCRNKAGFNWQTVREPLASLWYDTKIMVKKEQHAIWRIRELFYKALDYPKPNQQNIEYSLATESWQKLAIAEFLMPEEKYAVFLHGTTWETKYWPEEYWVELANKVSQQGIKVILPWGNNEEKQRAERILVKSSLKSAQGGVPKQMLSLNEMARCLKFAEFVVSVDTGLSHVAAALDVKMVVLYRVTDPFKVGAKGKNVTVLNSPLAHKYIKKFKDRSEEMASLKNITLDDVLPLVQEK